MARAATYGGLVFGAGGGGLEQGLRSAENVFVHGEPVLVGLDELADEDQIVVMSGVGAPGGHQRKLIWTSDNLRALDLVLAQLPDPRAVVGTMTSHPGSYMPGMWFVNAIRPELRVIDANTNGRGHPTVAMGGMGLAGRLDVNVFQAASGGDREFEGHAEVTVRAPLGKGSSILHHASAEVGGGMATSRGPFSVAFCREHGAAGAVSASIRLGEAMIAAEASGGDAVIAAIVETLGGRELGRGPLVEAGTRLEHNWDVGTLVVDAGGSRLEVVVVNEYMAVDIDGERVSTYPDLIVTLAPDTGMPTAASALTAGEDVVVVAVPKANIALGAGVWEPLVYREAEDLSGRELTRYALDGAPSA